MKHDSFNIKYNSIWNVSRSTFYDIEDLASYIKKAETNKIFRNEDLSSKKRKELGFNDFDSFEEAVVAMEYGYDKHLNKLQEEMKKAQKITFEKLLNKTGKYKKDVAGFVPIVPNAIVGLPINMINQDITQRRIPVCKMIIEKSITCGVDADDSIKYYSVLFTLIQVLEQKGIRCELWICATAKDCGDKNEIHTFKLKLKDAMKPINIYKLQFPIISADMFRRVGFRLLETCPTMTNRGWTFGYGSKTTGITAYDLDSDYKPNEGMQKVLDINDKTVYIPDIRTAKMQKKETEEILEYLTTKTALRDYIKIS